MKFLLLIIALFSFGSFAQGVQFKDGASSTLAKVDSNNNVRINQGPSTRVTYLVTVSGATTTAAYNLQVQAGASIGFKLSKVCVTMPGGATASGTVVTATISRRTTASTGGTALVNEGTTTTTISKMDPAAASYPGLAKGLAATLGTAGATLDQFQFPQLAVAAATPVVWCKDFGLNGEQLPTVAAGVNNGIAVNVSAGGAGSLAVGSISMSIITE